MGHGILTRVPSFIKKIYFVIFICSRCQAGTREHRVMGAYILNKHTNWHTLLPSVISRLVIFSKRAAYYFYDTDRTRDIDPGFTRLMLFFHLYNRSFFCTIVRPDDKRQTQ